MTPVTHALRAILHGREWGTHATLRYVERHGAIAHYAVALMFELRRKTRRSK